MIREYLAAVMPEREATLEALHKEATLNYVPIIKHEMEQFLTFIVTLHQPKRILEIGTAVGYSSIVMSRAMTPPPEITTLEKSPKMAELALDNFRTFGYASTIELIEGDAIESLKELHEPYDMVFMDAAKGQYMNFYEDAFRLLKVGGILIADNILQDGLIAKSRFAIPRRQRTIHHRMREFIRTISTTDQLTTSVLPIADGATISVKVRS
jgi:predicted O-methyltransferase YrrM